MSLKKIIGLSLGLLLISTTTYSKTYEVPPSSSSSSHAPVISDELMKQCVILYNQAMQLEKILANTIVNQYSAYEVNNYNINVNRLRQLVSSFNMNCAGKQSESAYRITKELNQQ